MARAKWHVITEGPFGTDIEAFEYVNDARIRAEELRVIADRLNRIDKASRKVYTTNLKGS